MAFGRSNSLSLNTGAVNNSFAAQQQSQPQQSGGLFGAAQPQQQSGGLFGSAQTSQPQQNGGGLFGGGAPTQTSQPQNSGSTFGGSLFGNNQPNQNQQSTQQTTGASSGGLFGGSLFGNNQQNQNQQSNQQQNTQQLPPAGGSLFGGSTFGSNQQNQQQSQPQQQQQPAGGSLFGGGSSLFGNQQQAPAQQKSVFSSLTPQPNQSTQNTAAPNPSLLATARHNQSQYRPFITGRLTMGQGSAPAQTTTGNPATKLNWNNLLPTTRFSDLTDDAKANIETLEKLVREQEDLCRQIEAFVPSHEASVATVAPDVRLVTDKLAEVESSLSSDAHGVQQDKNLKHKDDLDFARCLRVIQTAGQPAAGRYHPSQSSTNAPAWDPTYDTDLINNYFHPLTAEMGRLVDTYNNNLSEIENHVGTIEQSTVLQAQGLRAQRGGLGRRMGGGEDVRELAETLRGFEASILAAAGEVGRAREGVNELVMGRYGGAVRGRY